MLRATTESGREGGRQVGSEGGREAEMVWEGSHLNQETFSW